MIQPTTTTTVETFQVLDPVFVPPPGTPQAAFIESGFTNLPVGVQVANITFLTPKASPYIFEELEIVNSVDDPPLTIGYEVTSVPSLLTGFQITLDGLPNSINYFVKWRVAVPPP